MQLTNTTTRASDSLLLLALLLGSLLTSACSESPCQNMIELPLSIQALEILPEGAAACDFGSKTEDHRWPHRAYAKLFFDEQTHNQARVLMQRFSTASWEEVSCDGSLAGTTDSITICFLNPDHLVRVELYELNGTLVNFDLYATGP